MGTLHARDERAVQTFPVQDAAIFSKYLRVDMLSHYGTEHFCPLTVLRLPSLHHSYINNSCQLYFQLVHTSTYFDISGQIWHDNKSLGGRLCTRIFCICTVEEVVQCRSGKVLDL